GGKYPHLWHVRHMQDPTSTSPRSIMPAYPWLLTEKIAFSEVQARIDTLAMLGVPYGPAIGQAEALARAQASKIAAEIESQGGPKGLEDKQITALIAYLQRLGTDIRRKPKAPSDDASPRASQSGGSVHTATVTSP
ncbi:MAG: cbb3-type cytochrome c oxidase subunit II, partial [Pseudomonadota bacterium]